MFLNMNQFMDTQEMTKAWQKALDMNNMLSTSQQTMEAWQEASSTLSASMTTCVEKQMAMMQTSMSESVAAMQDLSAAKGIEDLMAKQNVLARKMADDAQSNSQELATIMQKGQEKALDIITKQLAKSMQQTGTSAKSAAASK